ncbi:MAG: adenylate/guanylate cyclase domain-containing protein [SAR324 cluster bacterium]|nr:adenylate/guanylate cyclase domain-containing protein [SAR324 cluster bacterium]
MPQLQTIRTTSGWILLTILALHLLGHAGGIFGLEGIEITGKLFELIADSKLTNWVFIVALLAHFFCAGEAILRRYSFRSLTQYQKWQYLTGFLIPFLLIGHLTTYILSHKLLDIHVGYKLTLLGFATAPLNAIMLSTMFTLVVIHAGLGVWFYMQSKEWFNHYKNTILVLLVLFPVLAYAGILSASHEVSEKAKMQPEWVVEILKDAVKVPTWENDKMNWASKGGSLYLTIIFLILATRWAITTNDNGKEVKISYPDGQIVRVSAGSTLLEASNFAHIPHAQLCQGHGRCSTCRVYISEGAENLEPMAAKEKEVLMRFKTNANVRLACQTKAINDAQVDLLISPEIASVQGVGKAQKFVSEEKEVVILFSDIRGFTKFSEHRLPYDVVFILNRYFQMVGTVIEKNGGYLDKFIGDGTMAIFGLSKSAEVATKQALQAAKEMDAALNKLNSELTSDLAEPLKIGIGLHFGKAIVGEMGYKTALSQTAIGDTVNTSSRLESLTKEAGAFMICSDAVLSNSGVKAQNATSGEVTVRGKSEALKVWYFKSADDIPELSDQSVKA